MRRSTRAYVAAAFIGCVLAPTPASAHGHNCADYATSAEATAAMGPGDPEGLDRDNDGVACEDSLPAGSTDSGESEAESPVGGVDAGMGGTASDQQLVPAGLALAGGGLAIGGMLMIRRRATQ
jgi:hypothetical protein